MGMLDEAEEASTDEGVGEGVGARVDDDDDDEGDDDCCSVLLLLSVSSTFLAGIEASFCRLLYMEGLLFARLQLWVLSE